MASLDSCPPWTRANGDSPCVTSGLNPTRRPLVKRLATQEQATMASQITCITTPDRYNDHEAITNVGGVRASGTGFYITREQCADDIRFNRESYFVHVGGYQVTVEAYQRT